MILGGGVDLNLTLWSIKISKTSFPSLFVK